MNALLLYCASAIAIAIVCGSSVVAHFYQYIFNGVKNWCFIVIFRMSLFIEHIACYDRKLSKSPFNNQIRYLIYRERTRYISSLSLSFLSVYFVCYAKKKNRTKNINVHTQQWMITRQTHFSIQFIYEKIRQKTHTNTRTLLIHHAKSQNANAIFLGCRWFGGKKSDKQQPKNKTVDATKMLFSPTTYFGM